MTKRKPRADGLYRVGIYLGKVDGKPKYKYVYGATQKAAEEKADDVRARMKKGLDVAADKECFGVWADRWLRIKRADVGPSQHRSLKAHIKRLSPLSPIPISKVTAYDIQAIITDLAICNPSTGKPSAKKTLNDIRGTARQILQLALDNRVIEYNPAQAVKIPKSSPKSSRRALTKEEQGWIASTPHRMQAAAMIMMYAGLRRGELIPLLWSDINLEERTISITKSVDLTGGKAEIKFCAKSEASLRTVDIPRRLADYLGGLERSSGLVCPGPSGKLFTATSWNAAWEAYMFDLELLYGDSEKTKKDEYGDMNIKRERKNDIRFKGFSIEPITAHMLRHTFCTLLYFAGVDVLTAQQQMGHADAKTTLNIYTHLDAKHKRKQMDKLDDYLNEGNHMGRDSSQSL